MSYCRPLITNDNDDGGVMWYLVYFVDVERSALARSEAVDVTHHNIAEACRE